MARKNPIERRLDILRDQWTEFAQNANARLLRWLAAADEVAIVDTFVAKESEPEACDTPDLFLRFDDAFELPDAHGFVLRETFVKRYEEARPALREEGLDASFVPPHAASSDDDVRAFLRVLHAYHAHQGGQVVLCVGYFRPDTVRDPSAYQLWLQRLAREAPAHLRFVALDSLEVPQLAALAEAEPRLVVSTSCDLDMPHATEELSREAGLDTPGAKFRHLLVLLGKAAKAADVSMAVPLAVQASQIAAALGWPHLGAVVQAQLAGVYTGAGRPIEALECYTEMDLLGQQTYERGESKAPAPEGAVELEGEVAKAYGLRLRRDARFGQGAILMSERAWDHAARVFMDAAPMSQALQDPRGQLDAFRLASVSFEQAGKVHEAWHCGMKGLEVGGAMDDSTRTTSTLAFLGEGMLRIAETDDYASHRQPIAQHMERLLGRKWRESTRVAAH